MPFIIRYWTKKGLGILTYNNDVFITGKQIIRILQQHKKYESF
jgi:hypothetical protein